MHGYRANVCVGRDREFRPGPRWRVLCPRSPLVGASVEKKKEGSGETWYQRRTEPTPQV
jgi:hypothetical protein